MVCGARKYYQEKKIKHRHKKTNLWLPKGKGQGRDKLGVWNQQIHSTIYKKDKQQGPTYSTGNYIQYLVIIYNGKESEKIYIYTYMYN